MTSKHSSVGLTIGARDEQQDCVMTVPMRRADAIVGELLVLADGMGGHAGGQEASRLVVETVVETFSAAPRTDTPLRLMRALEQANQAIATATDDDPELRGMGATLIAVAVDYKARMIHWISVGDSHLYLFSRAELQKLNADHSFAPLLAKQVAAGELTVQEAAVHEKRNTLMSAIIGRPIPMIDEGASPLEAGQSLLLASDGLDSLAQDQVVSTLRDASSTAAAVQRLLKLIEEEQRSEQDNTSVVVFHAAKSLFEGGDSMPSRNARASMSRSSKALLIVIIVASLLLSGGVAGWVIGVNSSSGSSEREQSQTSNDTNLPAGGQDVSAEDADLPGVNPNADIVENVSDEIVEANNLQVEEEREAQPANRNPRAAPSEAPSSNEGSPPAANQPSTVPSATPSSRIGPDFLEDDGLPDPEATTTPSKASSVDAANSS